MYDEEDYEVVTADAQSSRVIDLSKFRKETIQKREVMTSKSSNLVIPIGWLAAAAETYNISPDARDYVISEMPLVTADVPNVNADCFTLGELTRFSPDYGSMVYKSFIGKPTHQDHQNDDPLKAKGVNFDSVMVRQAFSEKVSIPVWKVRVLSGFDRTKDRVLANAIYKGERTGFSMGATLKDTRCSVCGQSTYKGAQCRCLGAPKGSIVVANGVARYKYNLCFGINFFENSSVGNPADYTAHSKQSW